MGTVGLIRGRVKRERMVELIDLAGRVEPDQPVYPGFQPTQIWSEVSHEWAGYRQRQQLGRETDSIRRHLHRAAAGPHAQSHAVLVSEHGPTHVDALSHIDPQYAESASIDRMELSWFYGDAVGIDVAHVTPDEYITRDVIQRELDRNDLALTTGDAILLHTGHRAANYDVADTASRYAYLYEYTGLDATAAEWLGEQGVKNIGIDSPSIDHSSCIETKAYVAHDACSRYEMINMEHMANLDAVAGIRFTLCAFPLKITGGTGSPIRPVAIIE